MNEDWGSFSTPTDTAPLATESPSILGRIGQRTANLPSELLNSLLRLGYNTGIKEPGQAQPESVPTPYDVPEAKTTGETLVDVGSKLAESVPFFLSGEGAGEGLAKISSAGPMLARMMKVGGGFATQGLTESPTQGAADATLGAGMGAVESMLPGPLRYLAAAGLGVGTGLMTKAEGGSDKQALIQGSVNAILPLLFGVRGKTPKSLGESHMPLLPWTDRLSLEDVQTARPIPGTGGPIPYGGKLPESTTRARPIFGTDQVPSRPIYVRPGESIIEGDFSEIPATRSQNSSAILPLPEPIFSPAEARRKAGILPPPGSLVREPNYSMGEITAGKTLSEEEALAKIKSNQPQPEVATLQPANGKVRVLLSTVLDHENPTVAQAAAEKLGLKFDGVIGDEASGQKWQFTPTSGGSTIAVPVGATFKDLKNAHNAMTERMAAPRMTKEEARAKLAELRQSQETKTGITSVAELDAAPTVNVIAQAKKLVGNETFEQIARDYQKDAAQSSSPFSKELASSSAVENAARDLIEDHLRKGEKGWVKSIDLEKYKVATLQPNPSPSPLETRLPHDLNAGDKARATIDGEHVVGAVHPGVEPDTIRFIEKDGTPHDLPPSKISPLGTKPPPATDVKSVGGLSDVEAIAEESRKAGGALSLGDSGGKMKLSNFGEHGGLPADIAIALGRYAVAPVVGAAIGYATDENHRLGSALAGAVIGGLFGHMGYRIFKLMAEAHPEVKVPGSIAEKIARISEAAKSDSKEFAKAVFSDSEKASRATTRWGTAINFDEMARWIENKFTRNPFVVRAMDKAHGAVQDLSEAIRKSVMGLSQIKDIDTHFESLTKYFEGKITHTQLMSLVPNVVSSLAATAKVATQGLQKILAEGLGAGKLSTKVEQSIGSYLTTSYKIFHDNKYKPTDAQILAAARSMSSEWGNLETRLIKINEYLTEIKQNKGLYGGSGESLGAALARKQELSPEFKAMLGEYSTPLERMSHTGIKLVNAAKSAEFFNEVANGTKANGLKYAYSTSEFESKVATLQQQVKLGHTPEIRQAATQSLHELNQYAWNAEGPTSGRLQHTFMDRRVRDQLSNYANDMQISSSAFMRGVMKVTNDIKYGQTVGSPLQFVRQIYQMPILGIMAKTNPRDWLRSFATIRDKTPEGLAELSRLKRLGVYGGDPVGGMLREDMSHMMDGTLDSLLGAKLSGNLHKWEELWRTPDLIVRVASFQRAEKRFIEEMGAGDAATNAAIDHMNRYTMNYGAVPPIVKYGRQLPFVNQYLSFTFEAIRITKNLVQDAAKGDVHAIGALSTLAVAPFIIQQMTESQLSEKDKKDWEQVKALSRNYDKYTFRFVQGRNPNGDFRYISFSPLVLHDPLLQSLRALMAGDASALTDTNPFIGWNNTPLLNVASSLVTGRNRTSNQQLLSFGDYAQSIRADVAPVLFGSDLDRIQRAFRPNDTGGFGVIDSRSGKVSSIEDILQTYLTSMRPYTVRPAYLLQQAKAETMDRIKAQQSSFRQIAATNASPEVKQVAIANYQTAVQHILIAYREKLGIDFNNAPQ